VDEERSTLLVVEDDAATRTFLADNLTADGFELLVAECARDGLRVLERKYPDLALIDLRLPDYDGLELIRQVREADGVASRVNPDTPLLAISGRSSELDRLRGFERGVDDYVVKPFSYPELLARVRALLRRSERRARLGRMRVGDLEVDPASREVRMRGGRVELSQKEFALLRTLAAEPTRVFTKEELLRNVWGFRAMGTSLRQGPYRPGRWTRMPAACGRSSEPKAIASSSTYGGIGGKARQNRTPALSRPLNIRRVALVGAAGDLRIRPGSGRGVAL
jgi:DNA-binding response OmpR family regulator